MEEDERFKHRCSSKEFMKQIVKFIFSCASQNDATFMRENSEAVSFSVKIIEEYVDAARQDTSQLDHDTGDSDEPKKSRPSSQMSFHDSDITIYEKTFSGKVANTLFELIGRISESFILGDTLTGKEKTTSLASGAQSCLMIFDVFPSYASQHLIRAYQLQTLQVLHMKLGQTLRSLRFDWLHNDSFMPRLQQLCEELVKKAMDGWFEACEHLVLLLLFDCLECAQKLSTVQKLDAKRRKSMVQSISSSVYSFVCFASSQNRDKLEAHNLQRVLKVINDNVQLLCLVDVSQMLHTDLPNSTPISDSGVDSRSRSSSSSSTSLNRRGTLAFQKFMSTENMFVNSTFSQNEFICCFCFLSYSIFEYDSIESRVLVNIWKDLFKFNHFRMLEIIGSSNTHMRQSNAHEKRDLFTEGFHLLLQQGKEAEFLSWIRLLKSENDEIVKNTISRTTARSWNKRERYFSVPKVPFQRLIEIMRLEESKEGPSKKIIRKNVTLSDAPAICQSTVYELCKSVNKTCAEELKSWEQCILMGHLSWHTRLATHHRSHLLDGDQMEDGYPLKWRLDGSEAYSRMRRRLKPNPNFFKTYGLKTESEPKESGKAIAYTNDYRNHLRHSSEKP